MRRFSRSRTGLALGAAATAAAALTVTAAPALAGPGPDERESVTIYADVDGDGWPNAVTVREVGPQTQTLTFSFGDHVVGTSFTADSSTPLQPPRRVDINGDGTHEVLVAHAVGANTLTFGIWKYEPGQGAVRLTTSAGGPFDVFEGGGVSAISGYGCQPVPGGREFVTVNAQLVDAPGNAPRYSGDRTTYSVNLNAVTVESRTPIDHAPPDDPRLATDPATCTP